MLTAEDVVILKKFYNVETDMDLIEAQHLHIERLQDSITSVKWQDVALRVKPRFAAIALLTILISSSIAHAEPYAQIPLPEFTQLIGMVDLKEQP